MSKRINDHLLRSASCGNTLLGLTQLERHIPPISVYFWAYKRRSKIRHLCRYHAQLFTQHHCIFLIPIDTSIFYFFGDCQSFEKFSWLNVDAKFVHAFHNNKGVPQSYGMLHDDYAFSVRAQHRWFQAQQLIFDDIL